MTESMIILGIDPGFASTGFAILDCRFSDERSILRECGTIRTSEKLSFVERLIELETNLRELLDRHQPTSAAVETLFFTVNKKTAIHVAHARGLILRTLYYASLSIGEYSPPQIKKAVTGNGRASKLEVQGMLGTLLGLEANIRQDDAADAVAVAICHSHFHEQVSIGGGR